MNQWLFVASAYAVVIAATMILITVSLVSMRRAESDAEAVKSRR